MTFPNADGTRLVFFSLLLSVVVCSNLACQPGSSTVPVKNDGEPVTRPIAQIDPADEPRELPNAAEEVRSADMSGDAESTGENSEIRILAWNIESNGANPDVIADQLKEMPSYDIYGFSEVRPAGFPAIKSALGNQFFYLYSQSGGDDRLAFAIRKDRFDILDHYEFPEAHGHLINPGNYRSPFVFDLKDRQTNRTFLIMINHLARGRAEMRQEQALALRKWAAGINRPVIAIGDYNFDYVFATDKGNAAMEIFLQDGTYQWLRPDPMIDSNYYDEDQDGVDDYIDSLLDFAFVAGEAKQWDAECDIIVREGDFPDDLQTSDHRPVQVIIR